MHYDAVFFDFDGTVADTLQNIANAVNHTMEHFGRPTFSPETLKHHLGWGVDYLMRHLLPTISEAEVREILRYYRPYYAMHATEDVLPYPDILPMLEKLHRSGLPLAIISNKPDSAMRPVAELYFRDLISLAIGELPGIVRKPAPDMLIHTANELRVDISRCVYVGDTEVDIRTAENAGIDCICVTWGFRTREELVRAGAELIADSTEELLRLILQ